MKVKISREARILVGLMFAAAAVLVWINFFTQQRQGFNLFGSQTTVPSTSALPQSSSEYIEEQSESVTPEVSESSASLLDPTTLTPTADSTTGVTAIDPTAIEVNPVTIDVTAVDPTALVTETPTESEAAIVDVAADATVTPSGVSATDAAQVVPVEVASETSVTAAIPEVTAESLDVAEATPVALPTVAAPTAARDIELAELPFLVTELPVAEPTEGAEATASLEIARPGERRASINPFAPIVLAPVEAEVVPLPDAQQIVEVPIPDEPATLTVVEPPAGVETQTVSQADGVIQPGDPVETVALETPLPEALTPAPEVASLPRPLPGGTLPVAPEILRTMSRTDAPIGETDVASELQPQVAEVEVAIRLPDQAPIVPVTAAEESEPVLAEADELELQPVTGLASDIEAAPNGGPIAAGLSGLSRYLRDNDVRFTGSVIGPVGVGIFRSTTTQAPYVITLGQTIPNTDIVLTSLQGKQAQFTQGQEVQSLTLDLRR